MPQYVQIAAVFIGVVLLARILDEVFARWRKRKRDEKDDENK